MKYLNAAIVWTLAGLFLFAGVDKLLHYPGFVNALSNYVLMPRGWAEVLALPVILAELAIGAGLLVRPWRQTAALLGAGLLALFTVALLVNAQVGDRGICGCWFSLTLAKGTGMHTLFNLLFIGLAGFVWSDARAVNRKITPSEMPT